MKETPKHQPKPSSSLPLENASIYHKEKDDKRDDTVFDTKRVQEFLKTLNVSNEKFDQNTLIEILRQNSRFFFFFFFYNHFTSRFICSLSAINIVAQCF